MADGANESLTENERRHLSTFRLWYRLADLRDKLARAASDHNGATAYISREIMEQANILVDMVKKLVDEAEEELREVDDAP